MYLPIKSLLFKSVPLLKSKFRHSTFLWRQRSRRERKKVFKKLLTFSDTSSEQTVCLTLQRQQRVDRSSQSCQGC